MAITKPLIILLLALKTFQNISKIIHLTEKNLKNFEKTKKTSNRLEIYYFKNGKKSNFIINALPELSKSISEIPIYLINCKEENLYICNPYELKYLPHITFRKENSIVENIESGLSIKSIIEKINNFNKNFVTNLFLEKDFEIIDESIFRNGFALVYIGGKPEVEILKNFENSCIFFRNEIKGFIIENELILARLGLENEKKGIYLLRDKNPKFLYYDNELYKNLNDFIEKNMFEKIQELTSEFWQKSQNYFKQGRNLFFFYNEDCDKKEKKILEKARFFFKYNQIGFFMITKKKNKKLYKKLEKIFGVPNFCTFVITKKINDFTWEKIMFPGNYPFEDVNVFLENVKLGNVKFYFKSEKESKIEKNFLNGDNINFVLKNLIKPKFILFFSNFSKNKKIFLDFKKIIDEKKIDDSFEIFLFNLDLNDYKDFVIDEEPLILFFDEDEPENYDGKVVIEGFREFVKQVELENNQDL